MEVMHVSIFVTLFKLIWGEKANPAEPGNIVFNDDNDYDE